MLASCSIPLLHTLLLLLLTCLTTVACQAMDPQAGGTPGQVRRRRADDGSLSSVEATVLQLQARLTAVENTLPASFDKVGFSVGFTRDNYNHGLAFSPNSILNFDSVVTSSPSHAFDPHTGVFTAPVSGLYAFFVSFMSVNTFGQTHLALMKDGTVLKAVFANGGDDYDKGSLLMVVQVTAGQKVYVTMLLGRAVRGGEYTTFTGFLLQAD